MKIVKFNLRAVVERVTEIEVNMFGENTRLFVFENLDQKGVPCKYWVQNWECDDITDTLNNDNHRTIKNALYEHYKSASNSSE